MKFTPRKIGALVVAGLVLPALHNAIGSSTVRAPAVLEQDFSASVCRRPLQIHKRRLDLRPRNEVKATQKPRLHLTLYVPALRVSTNTEEVDVE
jgi:hypothetical protein